MKDRYPPGPWPEAPVERWLETCGTIHMWSQIVGKIRLARAPRMNHTWEATLYVTARGFSTGLVPDGNRAFQIDFDFVAHRLLIETTDGRREEMRLASQPLADFYNALLGKLSSLGIAVRIWPVPVELPVAVPFLEDKGHSVYRPEVAEALWRILVIADMCFTEFRSSFLGKASPVHLFWGSFDLAVTRFSGRRAPQHPGGIPNLPDRITQEAYSHEVSSCGFWPGTAGVFERPAFYAYAYPVPPDFESAPAGPPQAYFSAEMKEFLLPYDAIRAEPDPGALLREFLQSTYAAAADLGGWNRAELER